MTGPNGDSFDGFVFPPFIPTASRATPAPAPAPAAAPPSRPVEDPRPSANDAVDAQPARVTMPWDAETPIVRDADAGHADAEGDEDEHEDLPWLEVPAPRERAAPQAGSAEFLADDVSPAAESTAAEAEADEPRAAPAANDAFPDWMAWGATDEADAAREMGNVDPVAGLENLVPMNDAPDTRDEDEGATLAASPVEDEPVFDPADLHAPRPEPRREPPAADADFLAAGFGGGDFLLRALQGSQLAPAEEPAAPAVSTADIESVPVAATPPAEQPAAVAHALADTFGEVAGRLEAIARTLRERPDSLLSGGSDDPLALLVTGYVLGYTQGRRS